jgi:hypothetical protein
MKLKSYQYLLSIKLGAISSRLRMLDILGSSKNAKYVSNELIIGTKSLKRIFVFKANPLLFTGIRLKTV